MTSNNGEGLKAFALDRVSRAARSLTKKDWERPSDIRLARHMAWAGASAQEISDALGWGVTQHCAWKRLTKYGIKTHPHKRAHRGDKTSLPHGDPTFKIYRPRAVRAAK